MSIADTISPEVDNQKARVELYELEELERNKLTVHHPNKVILMPESILFSRRPLIRLSPSQKYFVLGDMYSFDLFSLNLSPPHSTHFYDDKIGVDLGSSISYEMNTCAFPDNDIESIGSKGFKLKSGSINSFSGQKFESTPPIDYYKLDTPKKGLPKINIKVNHSGVYHMAYEDSAHKSTLDVRMGRIAFKKWEHEDTHYIKLPFDVEVTSPAGDSGLAFFEHCAYFFNQESCYVYDFEKKRGELFVWNDTKQGVYCVANLFPNGQVVIVKIFETPNHVGYHYNVLVFKKGELLKRFNFRYQSHDPKIISNRLALSFGPQKVGKYLVLPERSCSEYYVYHFEDVTSRDIYSGFKLRSNSLAYFFDDIVNGIIYSFSGKAQQQ